MKRFNMALGLALCLPLASACGDDDGPCSIDADCGDGLICDFRSGACVSACTSDAVCGAQLNRCNNDSANTLAPAVCVCTPPSAGVEGSCLEPSVCRPDGTCGDPTGTEGCGEVGTQGDCAAGEICQADGTCAAPMPCTVGETETCDMGQVCGVSQSCEAQCDNAGADGCFSNGQLCDPRAMENTFNQCAAPEVVTQTCDRTTAHMRGMNGPILFNVEPTGNPEASPACDNGNVQRFAASVYAPNGLPASLYTQGVRFLNAQGNETDTFDTAMREAGAGADEYRVRFGLCLSNAMMMQQLAIFINDSERRASNAFCFTAR